MPFHRERNSQSSLYRSQHKRESTPLRVELPAFLETERVANDMEFWYGVLDSSGFLETPVMCIWLSKWHVG